MLAGSSPGRTAQAADVSVDGAVGIPGGPCHASSALVAWQASAALVAWQARCSTFRASAVCRVWVWPPWCRCPSLDVYDSLVEPRPITTSACSSHSTRTRPQAYSVIAEIASPTEPTFLAATGVPNERSRKVADFFQHGDQLQHLRIRHGSCLWLLLRCLLRRRRLSVDGARCVVRRRPRVRFQPFALLPHVEVAGRSFGHSDIKQQKKIDEIRRIQQKKIDEI